MRNMGVFSLLMAAAHFRSEVQVYTYPNAAAVAELVHVQATVATAAWQPLARKQHSTSSALQHRPPSMGNPCQKTLKVFNAAAVLLPLQKRHRFYYDKRSMLSC